MDKKVLIIGTGGVASAAIMAAKDAGLTVYVTSTSVNDAKKTQVEEMGGILLPVTFSADSLYESNPAKNIAEWFNDNGVVLDFVLSSAAAGIAGFISEQKKKKSLAGMGFLKSLASGSLTQEDVPKPLQKRLKYGFGGHLMYLECDLEDAGVLSESCQFFAVSYSGECYYPVAFAKRHLEKVCAENGYKVFSIPEIANKAADVFAGLRLFVLYYACKANKYEGHISSVVESEMDELLQNKVENPIGDYIYANELVRITELVKADIGEKEFMDITNMFSGILNDEVAKIYISEMLNPKMETGDHYMVTASSIYASLDGSDLDMLKMDITATREREEKNTFSFDDMLALGIFGENFLLPNFVSVDDNRKYAWGYMDVPLLDEKNSNPNIKIKQDILESHFPGSPVLPGNIASELGCQVAACGYMLTNNSDEKMYPQLLSIDGYKPILIQPGDKVCVDTLILSETKAGFEVMIRLQCGIQSTVFTTKCKFVSLKDWDKSIKRLTLSFD